VFTHYLPFTICLLVLSMCVLIVVLQLNYMPRSGGESPREFFLGRKPDAKRDFRCAFGDCVMSSVANTESIMSSHTEEGTVMFPTGNRTGSESVLCCNGENRHKRSAANTPYAYVSSSTHECACHQRRTDPTSQAPCTTPPPPACLVRHITHYPISSLRSPVQERTHIVIRDPAPPPIPELADESGLPPLDTPNALNQPHVRGGGCKPSRPTHRSACREEPPRSI
jgi:hypothetical protein